MEAAGLMNPSLSFFRPERIREAARRRSAGISNSPGGHQQTDPASGRIWYQPYYAGNQKAG